jgi:hypothetical protein
VLQLLHLHFAPDAESITGRPFGEILRQHRDESGFTQEQLAFPMVTCPAGRLGSGIRTTEGLM